MNITQERLRDLLTVAYFKGKNDVGEKHFTEWVDTLKVMVKK